MKNWAENVEYTAERSARPLNEDELQQVVLSDRRVKALGSRHSFNRCADTDGTLVDMRGFDSTVRVQSDTVEVGAGATYADVAGALAVHGLALPNLASLPHVSVAGAIQTGSHGSGVGNPALSGAVIAFELMRGDGRIDRLTQGTAEFDASLVGIGALGIVTKVELRCVPDFQVAQSVHEGLPWDSALANWDDLSRCAYSVSVFTTYEGDTIPQVWTKHRVGDAEGVDLDD